MQAETLLRALRKMKFTISFAIRIWLLKNVKRVKFCLFARVVAKLMPIYITMSMHVLQ